MLTKDQLAELAKCSKKTVDRAITRFTRDGIVEVRPHYAENGGQLANEYIVTSFAVQPEKPSRFEGAMPIDFLEQPNNASDTPDAAARLDSCAQKAAAP